MPKLWSDQLFEDVAYDLVNFFTDFFESIVVIKNDCLMANFNNHNIFINIKRLDEEFFVYFYNNDKSPCQYLHSFNIKQLYNENTKLLLKETLNGIA